MPVLGEQDKYYSSTLIKDNPEYYKIQDKIIDDLLKKKIKKFTVGFDYNYLKIKEPKAKQVEYNKQKYIKIYNNLTDFDMLLPLHWTDIIIRRDGTIEIVTQGGGIYIKLENKK